METSGSFIPRSTWTLIEANTGIICACLPMLKEPLTTLLARLFRGTTKGSTARPSRNSYHLNSHPTANTWVSSDGTVMSSVTAGQQKLGPHARDSEEEQIIGSQHRNQPRGIMRKTDVVVSHHCVGAESTPSLKNATSVKEHVWVDTSAIPFSTSVRQ